MRRALLTTCTVLTAALLAGCGSAGSDGDEGPASLAPASAPVFFQATVNPSGERGEDAKAALSKILRTSDPGGKLTQLIDDGLSDDKLTWDRDFKPWLGEEAGFWIDGSAIKAASDEQDTPGAAIIEVSDEEAAKEALPRLQSNGPKKSYEGVDYWVDQDDQTVAGLVDGFVVVGPEAQFKQTVDTRDADSLADSERYGDAVDELDGDRLGHWYVDVKRLIDLAARQDPSSAEQLDQVKAFVPFDKLEPIVGSVQADGSRVVVDSVATGVPEGVLRKLGGLADAGDSSLLESMPADAWGGFQLPDVGSHARELFSAGAGAIGAAAIGAQVRQDTGLDLEGDLFSWMGDMAIFVRGENPDALDGALVIESTDDDKAAGAFGKLVALVSQQAGGAGAAKPIQIEGAQSAVAIASPGAPQKVVLARGEGRVVAAFGEKAAADGLGADQTLGSTDLWKGAETVLGDDYSPSLVLSMDAILKLVDTSGSSDPEFEKARPYLEAFGAIAAGGNSDDDKISSRSGASLK